MIQTERLRIEPLEMKYAESYFKGFNSEIAKYQWPDPYETLEDAEAMLKDFIAEMNAEESLYYAILNGDEVFVGSVEVHGLSEDCCELGIWITQNEQKKGYAFEALDAVLEYVCAKYQKKAFFYEADSRNEGSNKLLKKLSNKFELIDRGVEELVTDSGKELKLQGYILKAKE